MELTLQKYRNRLVNLSSRNRALVLKKLHSKRSFDLSILDSYDLSTTNELVDFLIQRNKKDLKILSSPYESKLDEEEMEKLLKLSKSLKNIKAEIDMVNKERGSYDLYIGYLFIEGYFLDKTFVKAPLLLFPVKIYESNGEWYLSNIDQNVVINRTFIMGYKQYNQIKIEDFDLEIESFDEGFIDALLEYLDDKGIKINKDSFSNNIEKFVEYKISEIPEYKIGDLFLKNNIILGQFPISDNSLNEDYAKLLSNIPQSGLLKNILESNEYEDTTSENEVSSISYDNTDKSKKNFTENEMFLLSDIDYSQENAVFASKNYDQLVIYGPPGTGKSQVITNLVANNLAENKMVLMVSQKKAALDVVYNRLSKYGLKDRVALVYDYNLNWKDVFNKVTNVLDEEDLIPNNTSNINLLSRKIDNDVERLDKISKILYLETSFGLNPFQLYSRSKNDLNFYLDDLADNFQKYITLKNLQVEESSKKIGALIDFLRFDFSTSLIKDRKDFSSISEIEKERISLKFNNLQGNVSKLFSCNYKNLNISSYLLNKINVESLESSVNFITTKIEDCKKIPKVIDSYKYPNLNEIKEKYDFLVTKEKWILNHSSSEEDFNELIDFIELKGKEIKDLTKVLDKEKYNKLEEITKNKNLVKLNKWWTLSFWKAKSYLKNIFQVSDIYSIFNLVDDTNKFVELKSEIETKLALKTLDYTGYTEEVFKKLQYTLKDIHSFDESIKTLKKYFPYNTIEESLNLVFHTINYDNLIKSINKELNINIEYNEKHLDYAIFLEDIKLNLLNTIDIFKSITEFSNYFLDGHLKVLKEKILTSNQDILKILNETKNELVAHFDDIKKYDKIKLKLLDYEIDFIKYCKNKYSENIAELKKSEKAIMNTFMIKHLENLDHSYTEVLEYISEEQKIREIITENIETKKALMPDYITKNLVSKIEANKTYNRVGTEITYKNIRYEARRQRNKLTLRKFVNEFCNKGLFNILPCWLVTPEVASAIFPLQEGLFDIVIFDEASQMFVENAIPSLYRAKKVVVAGDDKQLQPSNLYQVKLDEDNELDDEDEYIDNSSVEAKSLLDLAKVKYRDVTLTYHYRSLYEELINFSNYAFYGGKIEIIPNRIKDPEYKPIERILVEGKLINRKNKEEASCIVNLVSKILKEREHNESIGIITFNSTQKECISDILDQEARLNSDFRELYQKEIERKDGDEDVSLFIKNIENVQGDERDIIIFSIGYAPNEQGRVMLRFGTLNQEGGENRLNVAISRAKRKIYVVTSIEPEELNVDNSKNDGPKLFKKYLQFARAVSNGNKEEELTILNGLINKEFLNNNSTLSFDSPFEEEVYEKVTGLGYEVHTQVGCSGYKIDMAIFDRRKAEYILGIECDGAMYHSSKSARERDIYRQKFLESRGWKIHRIWSKNWWKNPHFEIEKIKVLLNK